MGAFNYLKLIFLLTNKIINFNNNNNNILYDIKPIII